MPSKLLSLASATQRGPAVVRVEFTSIPKAADARKPNDALNPANWQLVGPGASVAPVMVKPVSGYLKKFDLFFAATLTAGNWTISIANVTHPLGTPLTAPTTLTFVASPPNGIASFTPLDSPSEADALRAFLNPVLVGPVWDSLVQTIGAGEQRNRDDARSAHDQLYIPTASGSYLTSLVVGQGGARPKNVGMKDADFSRLAIALKTGKLTEISLRAALEPFYGPDTSGAFALSGPEPFALFGGEDLRLITDEHLPVTATFQVSDFVTPGTATSAEVSAALCRAFGDAGSVAWAAPQKSPVGGTTRVKIRAGSLGPRSAIRVTGGLAQNVLLFPLQLVLLNGALPTWNVTPNAFDGTVTYSSSGASGLDLSTLRTGDYVNIYGGEFLAANRGSFPVTAVAVSYPGGTLLQSFTISNRSGAIQVGLVQLVAASVLYFRPAAQRAANGPRVLSVGNGEVMVTLPATASLGRAIGSATYLRDARSVAISSVQRTGTTAKATAAAHGLSVGSHVIVDKVYPDDVAPAIRAGGAGVATASLASAWASLSAAPAATYRHQALLLPDGRVLIIGGGTTGGGTIPTAATNACSLLTVSGPAILGTGESQYSYTWTADTALPAASPLCLDRATLLPNGKVFVSGGYAPATPGFVATSFLYTPAGGGVGSWAAGPAMSIPRAGHGQILLKDGRVLIAGGVTTGNVVVATCQIYNPATNAYVAAATMNWPRFLHRLTLLSDGKVLAVGDAIGFSSGAPPATSEVYDPIGNTWTLVGSLSMSRAEPAVVTLASGRVLTCGGTGYGVTLPLATGTLSTCESYDPQTKAWTPAGSMEGGRSDAEIMTGFSDGLLRGGGGSITSTGLLDPNTGTWRSSAAILPSSRRWAEYVVGPSGAWALCSGGLDPGTGLPTASWFLLVPASEVYGAGGFSGIKTVVSVVDANTFTYNTPEQTGYSLGSAGTGVVMAAQAALPGIPGAHIWDPNGTSPAITSIETTTTVLVVAGASYATLPVADASKFPNTPGWLCLGFGHSYQASPVRYLGRASLTSLILDFTSAPTSVPLGAKVTLLTGKSAFVPTDTKAVGSFYLTDAPSARAAAEQTVIDASAAGTDLDITIQYPGDRGLGGERLPTSGVPKLSDIVGIWAEDVDTEVAAARLTS